ncbi:hypothetical protein V8E54_011626 [Elaphomyces granulatus]
MSASEMQKEMALLRRQAAKAFLSREVFKRVVWVGVFGNASKVQRGVAIDVVIFYDPKYSEQQIWDWYASCKEDMNRDDPDESKLLRVWGRKINICSKDLRWHLGHPTLEDVKALLLAWTVYGNPVDKTLDKIRSSCFRKVEKYQKKLSECESLAYAVKESEDGSNVCKKSFPSASPS